MQRYKNTCGLDTTLQYDTIEEFNVEDSKVECDQCKLAHITKNKKI